MPHTTDTGRIRTARRTRSAFFWRRSSSSRGSAPIPASRAAHVNDPTATRVGRPTRRDPRLVHRRIFARCCSARQPVRSIMLVCSFWKEATFRYAAKQAWPQRTDGSSRPGSQPRVVDRINSKGSQVEPTEKDRVRRRIALHHHVRRLDPGSVRALHPGAGPHRLHRRCRRRQPHRLRSAPRDDPHRREHRHGRRAVPDPQAAERDASRSATSPPASWNPCSSPSASSASWRS